MQFTHKNIVKVYSTFHDDDSYNLILEYIPGGNLEQYLSQKLNKRLNEIEARTLIKQICQAVNYAHQKGIIHLNLKPTSILINNQLGYTTAGRVFKV